MQPVSLSARHKEDQAFSLKSSDPGEQGGQDARTNDVGRFGTICALLICSMVAVMFIGVFLSIDLADVVALLFVAGMLAFIGALLAFLSEVFIAVKTLRIGMK